MHSLSKRDLAIVDRGMGLVSNHSSGGTYNMVAIWAKGSKFHVGQNELYKLAQTECAHYPDISGIHAELDLYLKMGRSMRGGTVYVIGEKEHNSNMMRNTKPCIYCYELLRTTNTNWVVYSSNGRFIKSKVGELSYASNRY